MTTLLGVPGTPGSADSFREPARFDTPASLTSDAAGNLLIADTGNHAIRQFGAGVVTTIAGQAGNGGTNDGTSAAIPFITSQPQDRDFSQGDGSGNKCCQ